MKISEEKARLMDVSWPWIRFILGNIDLVMAINRAPVHIIRVNSSHFKGKAFGLRFLLETVEDAKPDPEDKVHMIADVRLPLNLSRSHTVIHFEYAAVNEQKTTLSLHFSFESTSLLMDFFLRLKMKEIENYLERLVADYEQAGRMLELNDPELKKLLNEEQLRRVDAFRKKLLMGIPAASQNGKAQAAALLGGECCLWQPELAELTSLYQRMENKASELEDELTRIRETRDGVLTLTVARRMLEVVVTQICEEKMKRDRGNEPLANLLNKIAQSDTVPDNIMASMQNLNRISTFGAHPKDFSPRQVREALMGLCSIMEWYTDFLSQDAKKG